MSCGDPHQPQCFALTLASHTVLRWSLIGPNFLQWPLPDSMSLWWGVTLTSTSAVLCDDPHRPSVFAVTPSCPNVQHFAVTLAGPIVLQWLLFGTNVLRWPSPTPGFCDELHQPYCLVVTLTANIAFQVTLINPSAFRVTLTTSLSCSDPHRPQCLPVTLTDPTVFWWPSPTPVSSGGPHRPHCLAVNLTGHTVLQWSFLGSNVLWCPSPAPVFCFNPCQLYCFEVILNWLQFLAVTLTKPCILLWTLHAPSFYSDFY